MRPLSLQLFRKDAAPSGAVLLGLILLMLVLPTACQTLPPLPPVNLQQPGWTVRQGQAVWTRKRGGSGIAGDILVATRPDGETFVQFSKSGLPMLIAQSTPHQWSVELPTESKHYSGGGRPPARLMLLYLPRALSDAPLPRGWRWQRLENNGWRLENGSSGESLEGYFTQ